ncbi:MAG: ABC transporter permease [Candidatus Diapherotrites archaeon]|nr:ABC transporter permease [Candidatus Diapherotrites archaeon]
MFDRELLQKALQDINSQGIRGKLTVLGLVIGIASIFMLISLGQSLESSVQQQFETLGTQTLIVLPGKGFIDTAFVKLGRNDAKHIEGLVGVEFAAEIYFKTLQVRHGTEKKTALVVGVEADKMDNFGALNILNVDNGRVFGAKEKFAAIAGKSFAENAFKEAIVPKKKIEIEDKKFEITGINAKPNNTFAGFFDNAVLINKDTLNEITPEPIYPLRIFAKVADGVDAEEVKARIGRRLEKDHGEEDFRVLDAKQLAETATSVLAVAQIFLVGIAFISLLVGAIGIMNTMLMAVTERTKEIGIMKAVGATDRQVLAMFLTESALIGLLGGIIGVILGSLLFFGLAFAASYAGFSLPADLNFGLAIGAMLFSAIIGMLSGTIPSLQAAKLDPVEAIRRK